MEVEIVRLDHIKFKSSLVKDTIIRDKRWEETSAAGSVFERPATGCSQSKKKGERL